MNKINIRNIIKETLENKAKTGFSDYIEGGKTKGLTHDELVTILTNAAKGIKPNKPKSEIKEGEGEDLTPVQPGAQDPVDTITLDIPLFLLLLEYAREKSEDDVDLHELTQTANKLGKERGILNSNDYNEIVGDENIPEEGPEAISENAKGKLREGVKKALFKKNIKEDKKTKAKDNEGGEELESSVNVEDTPPAAPEGEEAPVSNEENPSPENNKVTMANQGDGKVNPQVKAIQDALTQAQVAAQSLGDEKLLNQVGNTITFFTREYIVGANKPQV